jgi:hypothetical protein
MRFDVLASRAAPMVARKRMYPAGTSVISVSEAEPACNIPFLNKRANNRVSLDVSFNKDAPP